MGKDRVQQIEDKVDALVQAVGQLTKVVADIHGIKQEEKPQAPVIQNKELAKALAGLNTIFRASCASVKAMSQMDGK